MELRSNVMCSARKSLLPSKIGRLSKRDNCNDCNEIRSVQLSGLMIMRPMITFLMLENDHDDKVNDSLFTAGKRQL